jgi:hypothetical protein
MCRRFGFPFLSGDDYKDLSGAWMLSTPSESVIVYVNPSVSSPCFSFTPMWLANEDAEQKPWRDIEELNLSAGQAKEAKDAFEALLLDLLRPVCVRDSYINALGEVDDDSTLLRCNADGERIYEAKRHSSSGCSIPYGLMSGKSWGPLCGLIDRAGDGDIVKGGEAAVATLRRDTMVAASQEPAAVKRVIFAAVGRDDRDGFGALLGLSSEESQLLGQEVDCIFGVRAEEEESTKQARVDLLDKMDDEVLKRGEDYLDRLAMNSKVVLEGLDRVLVDRDCDDAWSDLVAGGEGDFPDEAIPSSLPAGCDLEETLRESFSRSRQSQHLVGWMMRTVSRRRGKQALGLIVMHLHNRLYEKRQAEAAEGTSA